MTDYSWLLDLDWLANVPQEELDKLLEGTGETVSEDDEFVYHPLTWPNDQPPEAA